MKDMLFVGDSHSVLSPFPEPVQRHVGFAPYQAQLGNKHPDAKPLRGFPGGVLEVVSDHRGDTFRAVYTVRLQGAVYILHAFQKKSKQGIATPKSEIDLVKQRLRLAIEIESEWEA
jgi:phage-related protein